MVRYPAYLAILALVLWSIDAIVIADTDWSRILNGTLLRTLGRFLDVDLGLVADLFQPALETVLMATVATLAGLVFSIPVAWLGAANITPLGKASYAFGRFLMTMSRSVHEIVWALIFVSAVGLGALAGVLAMAVRSIGFISKTIAEAIEDVDPKPVEAIRSAGGTRFQILLFAILPQIVPVFVGNMIFEWDINIRRSTVLGLVGAGGLGLVLFRQMAMSNFGGITTVILAVLALIVFGEVISYYARRAVI
jgi:phosphonate transport system permease protein